jgi:hypothetical protein
MTNGDKGGVPAQPTAIREVPVDWEALEDAFENNAPEVHSYLHLGTGEVLRVVDGIADPEMHARISADSNYMRVDPVSSREQYRWMERFIQMLDEGDLRDRLTQAIDGKGAFRRFKDVLMAHANERERWFAFRSERLRVFMEAWLGAHALMPIQRPVVFAASAPSAAGAEASGSQPPPPPAPLDPAARRARTAEAYRRQLREIAESLGPRDLEKVTAFAEFVKARRAQRSYSLRSDPEAADEPPLPDDVAEPDPDSQ